MGKYFLQGILYLEQQTGIHTPSRLILMEKYFGNESSEILEVLTQSIFMMRRGV